MPAVPAASLILVTGASGYIAAWAVRELLDRGFRVRGTVRSAAKGDYLAALFRDAADRFEYTIVESLEKPGGFDEAVRGVQGVLHIASPLYRTAPSGAWENIIKPARVGTTNVLEAALGSPTIQRIIITSSYAAIYNPSKPAGTVFDESDWNDFAIAKAHELGDNLDPLNAYYASKTMAEQAAWDFVKEHAPAYDIATIIPPQVCGPAIHPLAEPASLPTSGEFLWKILVGGEATEALSKPFIPMVDVRDVAHAHVEALVRPAAGGQRIGTSASSHSYQEFLDVFADTPEIAAAFPKANWGARGTRTESVKYGQDASRSRELLGLAYRSFEDTVLDTGRNLIARSEEYGWSRA